MEDGIFVPDTMLVAPFESAMDFDCINELFSEGCWLETADGSDFLQPSPSNADTFFDISNLWSASEVNNGNASVSLSQNNTHERQRSIFLENSPVSEPHGESIFNTQSVSQNMINLAGCSSQLENYTTEGSELSKRWWIGPKVNPGPGSSVMERLIQALGYIKDYIEDKNVLIQIWVPVYKGSRCVLTTDDQPYSLESDCPRLASYRNVSVNYEFPTQEDSKEILGLPGRVFLGKVPEWTPDVRFFRTDEYARVDHAQWYDVRGTLALPVFEQGSRTCLGVVEVVMTTQKIKYRPELESVCKALEAVDLGSSEVLSNQNVRVINESYQAALPEILEVLKLACVTHRLPLTQTWVPCLQQGKGGCRHSDENYVHCVSTVDSACYVADPHMQGFHEACSEHHLLKGQGVAGKAFTTNQPCFSTDATCFRKTEYPLSHHARIFGLRAAVAIRLRSVHAGATDFVLEFFLPVDCQDPEEQKKMLSSLSSIVQQVCQSLRVVTDKELEEETVDPVSEVIIPSESGTNNVGMLNTERTRAQSEVLGKKFPNFGQHQHASILKGSVEYGDYSTFGKESISNVGKAREKRRAKAEKTITLEVLQQYFAGSLKDAAKNIGVCPTTLKRICRQHGIKRWPSRTFKKVGHSLKKIQRVIDSVQGTSGAFQIGSFYSNFSELASPDLLGTSPFSTSKQSDYPKPLSAQTEGGIFSPCTASKSPSSSCSQSSSSSHCCSSGIQKLPSTWNVAGSKGATMVGNNPDEGVLKRVRSDADLHASSQEGPKLLPRSWSHKSLSEPQNYKSLLPLPKNSVQIFEGDGRRIKVSYGEEKIRFRMPNNWRFKDLLQEIARRFNIEETSEFQLKYLDDDSDWVSLTCDADLVECIDVCQSSQSETIKLSLQISHHQGSSLGGSSTL